MALSKQSAGNGSASGSAPHHVPASTPASLEAAAVMPAESAGLAYRTVIDSQSMLRAIGVLADQLLDMSNDDDVHAMADAVRACVDKGYAFLQTGEMELASLRVRLEASEGGLQ